MKPERLLFVDGLRGIAAVSVVLYHLCQRSPLASWTSKGGLGVIVFFVLSGFVIAMIAGAKPITLGYLGRFAARRSIRLDPPYWASLGIAAALIIAAGYMGEARELPELGQVVAHLTYTQDLLGIVPLSEVYWTLCLEIQFYLTLLAVLWLGRQKVGHLKFHVVWLAALVASLAEYTLTDISPTGLFLPYWWAFALGASLSWMRAGRLTHWAFGVLLLLCVPFAVGKHTDGLMAGVLTASVLWLAIHRQAMGSWLSGPVWQFAGRISYSLYLIHPLIGWSAQSVALKFAGPWIALAVGLVASVVSAVAMYWMVERPAIRLSHYVPTMRAAPVMLAPPASRS